MMTKSVLLRVKISVYEHIFVESIRVLKYAKESYINLIKIEYYQYNQQLQEFYM
ncbi:hypothetical protein A9CBEGH2_11670 [Amedibacterium intestinale]|uniref:Uncharacterized protein n=1 Tax=Amedibacterium intestinale TaxID=2583452 RepID=A0A6N4THB8_9FIRM|nr:hypothetical protein Aargi30884_10520 [Amedibacterium intestinale]BBK62227.1 hypothetical protein A9CBEGH2_11670 [Amedibacterium intestinale]